MSEFTKYFDYDEAFFNRKNNIHFKVVCIDDASSGGYKWHGVDSGNIYFAKWGSYGFDSYIVDTEIGHQVLPSYIFIPLDHYRDYKLDQLLS